MNKVALVAAASWGHYIFRLPLARALRERGHEVVFVCPLGEFTEKLEEQGFRCIDWALAPRSVNPAAEAMATWNLRKIYRTEKPAAVHHFAIKSILYGSLAAARTPGLRVLNSFTGVGFPFLDKTAQYPCCEFRWSLAWGLVGRGLAVGTVATPANALTEPVDPHY